jgi:acetolactate synthase-1/2/3 large subunit
MMKFVAAKTFEAWGMISRAKSPLALIGRGVRIANAIEELDAFITRTKLPVVTTYLGKDCYLKSRGVIGIKGCEEANYLLGKSDVLLVIGASLPIAQMGYEHEKFFERKVIIVNIEPPNKLTTPALFIQADCKEFFYEHNQILRTPQLEY